MEEEQLKANYTLSENGQDAGISVLYPGRRWRTKQLQAPASYHVQRDFTFEPKVFAE